MTSSSNFAIQILQLMRDRAVCDFPFFGESFGFLRALPRRGMGTALATDGLQLFFAEDPVCSLFLEDPETLYLLFLHVHLHCICLHPIKEGSDDASCDREVTLLLRTLLRSLSGSICRTDLQAIHDTHEFWSSKSEQENDSGAHQAPAASPDPVTDQTPSSNSDSTDTAIHILEIWKPILEKVQDFSASPEKGGKHGSRQSSGMIEAANLKEQDSIDYHSFLSRFTVPREEAVCDPDSFDYIPYYYGLSRYHNMPFIEPLEYSEVNRLDELAIAIDTSGSCSGPIVRRFLEETWSILRQKENFFSRMRIHLIQCDSVIQDYRIITSIEQWNDLLPKLEIIGHGDTDFTPVFDLIEKQKNAGEIRHLRALLYFTDGDGIYPSRKPDYDTAFVFLNEELEKYKIPSWGIRLNLNLPDL